MADDDDPYASQIYNKPDWRQSKKYDLFGGEDGGSGFT
jgi:hypothetical protein